MDIADGSDVNYQCIAVVTQLLTQATSKRLVNYFVFYLLVSNLCIGKIFIVNGTLIVYSALVFYFNLFI